MSRSYRKTPVASITAGGFNKGDKYYKTRSARLERRELSRVLDVMAEDVHVNRRVVFDYDNLCNKDGKAWFDPDKHWKDMIK